MKICSYCGKEHPDDAQVCGIDQRPLIDPSVARVEARPVARTPTIPRTICPQCGATDGLVYVPEFRQSFSLLALFLGGLPAIIFQNSSRPRRVRCTQCEARFSFQSTSAKISGVIF